MTALNQTGVTRVYGSQTNSAYYLDHRQAPDRHSCEGSHDRHMLAETSAMVLTQASTAFTQVSLPEPLC